MRLRRREERGATAVEFALVAIPFLVLVLGMIQYGWYFYVSQSTGSAASAVARRLQVGDCWGGTSAQTLARAHAPMIQTVSIADSAGTALAAAPDTGTTIVVTLTSDAEIIGLLPMPNGGAVVKEVQARAEDQTDSGAPCS